MDKTKIIMFGCQQAVCLPLKYHIYSNEVMIRQEKENIILSPVLLRDDMDELWKKALELVMTREQVFRR